MQYVCNAIFFCSLGLIVYALFGYPLLLGFIAKRHDRPVQKDERLRSVSFVIAVRNGEMFLERKIHSILALNYPRELIEILTGVRVAIEISEVEARDNCILRCFD